MIKNIIAVLSLLTIINLNAAQNELVVTPKVSFDSGYATRATHLGLQIQKNSAFFNSTVSLENSFLTPTLSATHYLAGENKSQTVLDASVSKGLFNNWGTATVGVENRMIGGGLGDTFTGYVGLRLNRVPILSSIATPYITVARDFDLSLVGATVGLDRTFKFSNIELSPRVEAYIYDKHKSYIAGSQIAYAGFKYIKPYVDVSYVTTDTSLAARKFDGNIAAVAGIKLSF